MNKAARLLSLVLAFGMLLFAFTAVAEETSELVDSPDTGIVERVPLENKAAEYLSDKFGADIGDVSAATINAVLEKLGTDPIEGADGDVTTAQLAKKAVDIAGMNQLAEAYTNEANPELASNLLSAHGIDPSAFNADELPYIAAAVELGLVDPATDFTAPLTGEVAADMLYKSLEIAGKGRHYIGCISDENILTDLRESMDSLIIFDDPVLTAVGEEIVMQGATTGYNLKYAGYDADFIDKYTLRYGHSDYVHAQQLVSLLKSSGFDGYLQIEPKVSVYEHMAEWGDPGEPTPTSETRTLDNGRMLTYAVEYDLMIEFPNTYQKEAFNNVIETYAKKYDDDYDADGNLTTKLIRGAWWQPLYSSNTPIENGDYTEIVNNVIYNEDKTFYIQSFSVPENADAVAGVVTEVAPELTTENLPLYTNNAFYRYITGESHQ